MTSTDRNATDDVGAAGAATLDVRGEFDLPAERIWLNTSHQGALPLVSAAAAEQAIRWKLQPHRMTTQRFGEVPLQLRTSIGRLVDVPAQEVILANGASYGLHLLANGLPLQAGDEVLLMAGDFPSNLLPWRAAVERGVKVKLLEPQDEVLSPQEIEAALSPRTRLVCLSWVHSFSGRVLDIAQIGSLCRDNGTWLAVNASQALGVRPLRVADYPVDAVFSVGWKWLCGPYATGFAWLSAELRGEMRAHQAYWQAAQNEASLQGENPEYLVPEHHDPRRYDVFGTANFFNFLPLTASIELLLGLGVDRVRDHVSALTGRLVDGLDPAHYKVISGVEEASRSSLVLFTHNEASRQGPIYQALRERGMDLALRMGRLRISPHLYNTLDDMDQVLSILHELA